MTTTEQRGGVTAATTRQVSVQRDLAPIAAEMTNQAAELLASGHPEAALGWLEVADVTTRIEAWIQSIGDKTVGRFPYVLLPRGEYDLEPGSKVSVGTRR